MLHRRRFLQLSTASLAAALASSRVAFAGAPTENRFVFVLLRGGLDGLHALIPYADSDFQRLRPQLAPGADERIDLDGYFALHARLGALMPLWHEGELAFVPAATTRYRNRSHFDGQNLLENGTGQPFGARDGWLNRAILGLNAGDRRLGLSLGPSVPLILQGGAHVQAWVDENLPDLDDDFLGRLAIVYRDDPLFARALADATGAPEPMMMGAEAPDNGFVLAATAAADLLSQAAGPRIAVMELGGWDTHTGQPGRLNRNFEVLAEGITTLKRGLGADWARTVVVVASEFGRTAAENGARGTDHGTGGLAILAGGAVRGGRIAGEWPGLTPTALYENRDVRAVNAYEAIFKSVLIAHLGLAPAYAERVVFPESGALEPFTGLLRA
ncbi:MAG: DUF1501 domain-containing protein [Rhodobacteraceae bacterium]|nr:DUF1501 domain-containing protein [Paracoccaceae bacterium]